jgi:hypothetical protein
MHIEKCFSICNLWIYTHTYNTVHPYKQLNCGKGKVRSLLWSEDRRQKSIVKDFCIADLSCITCNWCCLFYNVLLTFILMIKNNIGPLHRFISFITFLYLIWIPYKFFSTFFFQAVVFRKVLFRVWKNQLYIVNWVNLCMGLLCLLC